MRIRGAKVEVALPSGAKAPDTPTRSEAQMTSGVEGRTTMRSVALDLGRKISFCEVANDEVTSRATARSINELERQLGPETAPARVAFEACREGWFIDRRLREWGHEPLRWTPRGAGNWESGSIGRRPIESMPRFLRARSSAGGFR